MNNKVGYMKMPSHFRYRDVYLKGRPQHEGSDPFLFRHPNMSCRRRAKLFAPFDALRGFDAALMAEEASL